MNYAIETTGLTKTFQPTGWFFQEKQPPYTAVDSIDLAVNEGELFGLLGPNGAGKTTLVKMLCTLILPTSGAARVAGQPLSKAAAIRQAVGFVVTDERSFFWRLTGRQNLQFFATLYGLRGERARARLDAVLAAVELLPHADKRFHNYSTGMKQRLAIARGMLHEPQILFLDEPSRSLDPTATNRLHDLLLELKANRGITMFLITHDLAEAEKLCDRVAFMNGGQIQAIGHPADLRRQLRPYVNYTLRVTALPAGIHTQLLQLAPGLTIDEDRHSLHFQAGERDAVLDQIMRRLHAHDVQVLNVFGQPATLEEVFNHYTAAAAKGAS